MRWRSTTNGDYKKAVRALSQGRPADAFAELDKLQWIKEVPDRERNQQLAAAYLKACNEKKNGEDKTALSLRCMPGGSRHAGAAGDRIRIAAGGKTKDGKHRLGNGDLLTVEGFARGNGGQGIRGHRQPVVAGDQ
jgi:hypothetical protein